MHPPAAQADRDPYPQSRTSKIAQHVSSTRQERAPSAADKDGSISPGWALPYRLLVPTHFVAHWQHDNEDDPVRIFEEVDDDRFETRKVEEFRDGRLVRADSGTDAATSLSWEPLPDMVEIEDQAEFTVELLTRAQFEAVWNRAADSID
jgi:hypothetical protein